MIRTAVTMSMCKCGLYNYVYNITTITNKLGLSFIVKKEKRGREKALQLSQSNHEVTKGQFQTSTKFVHSCVCVIQTKSNKFKQSQFIKISYNALKSLKIPKNQKKKPLNHFKSIKIPKIPLNPLKSL